MKLQEELKIKEERSAEAYAAAKEAEKQMHSCGEGNERRGGK